MTTPFASPSAIERQVAAALRRGGFSSSGATMVVAASGGPDSTALLRCLLRLRDEHRLTLHVAHLNHDFRGAEADHDAAFVQRLSDDLGLSCSIDKRDPIAYQRERGVSSFEQAAREMRYSFLGSVSASVGAKAVALGHTADDQAETVLLHLLRGSGLHGLRRLSELTKWPWPEPNPGPLLFRPLLGMGKAETAAYCRNLGQTFREDSGNYMWRFTRNKVRRDLMPRLTRDYNPRVREALARLSRAADEDLDFIEGELTRQWPGIAEERENAVIFNTRSLSPLHPSLQRHALRRAYATVAGDARRLKESHLEAMLLLLRREASGRTGNLPRGVHARRQGDTLIVARNPGKSQALDFSAERVVTFPQAPGEYLDEEIGGWRLRAHIVEPQEPGPESNHQLPRFTARLSAQALGSAATLRTRRPGDRFQPFGMAGTKKLQDFFTDAKIPREQRDGVPLLVCERGIAWVVGHRVAGWAAADAGEQALHVILSLLDPLGDTACF